MHYFIRDSWGRDFRIGIWRYGTWTPGSRNDAIRELRLLDEPGAYVWGRTYAWTRGA